MPARHRFGRFEVRPDQRSLLADGRPTALGARAFDLLLALIERRQKVIAQGTDWRFLNELKLERKA